MKFLFIVKNGTIKAIDILKWQDKKPGGMKGTARRALELP